LRVEEDGYVAPSKIEVKGKGVEINVTEIAAE